MDIEGTAKACKNLEKLHMKMEVRAVSFTLKLRGNMLSLCQEWLCLLSYLCLVGEECLLVHLALCFECFIVSSLFYSL